MLDLEDRRADARSAAETAQFEPGADRGAWPDAAAPKTERWPRPDADTETHESGADELSREGRFRRHPVVFVVASACLLLAAAAGYLYWDNSSHFEATDDAYIASRQFAIAPEVSGYITAVPVTDNEHVNAGAVIARIDDRTYRAALAQAVAQVAAAHANIENVDAQLTVQQAQIDADQAQLSQQQASLVFAQQQAARYQYLAQTIAGTVQNAQQYTSQLNQQQAAVDSAQATFKLAAAGRSPEGATRQRRRQPGTSQSPARTGATQPFIHHSYGRPGRACRPTRSLGRPIRAAGRKPDDVRPR
jgi:membrane fusion protein (multidrug efflux system)